MSAMKETAKERWPEPTTGVSEPDVFAVPISTDKQYHLWRKDVVARHRDAATGMIKILDRTTLSDGEVYTAVPVLLAENVGTDILDTLPSNVGHFRVKCIVRNNNLFLIALSRGDYHSVGGVELSRQIGNFCRSSKSVFVPLSECTKSFSEGDAAAPAGVICIAPRHSDNKRNAVFIVEIEVNNRSVFDMRRDFVGYFAEDSVVAVMGIKFFSEIAHPSPVRRAAAVLWTRHHGEPVEAVVVAAVYDFGIVPLTAQIKDHFWQAREEFLPGVPPGGWDDSRCNPVPSDENGNPAVANPLQWLQNCETSDQVYPVGNRPVHTFAADTFDHFLLNVPARHFEGLDRFQLDLASILHQIATATVI